MFHISPNISINPLNGDIAPAITSAVNVKSKRNKKPKNEESSTNLILRHRESRVSMNIESRELSPIHSSPPSSPQVAVAESLANLRASSTLAPLTSPLPPHALSPSGDFNSALAFFSEWARSVNETLQNSIEWQTVAFEQIDNKQFPIFRCPSCWVYRDTHKAATRPHLPDCKV